MRGYSGGDKNRISIHALRVEGDTIPTEAEVKALLISIHALRVEGDGFPRLSKLLERLFLSTPSGWRATVLSLVLLIVLPFLSTPSGWRAT